ncbi:hypothetical protein SESBI_04010 [Sesbania bispinosa]|nr:hypothetical protein SESBI_04010 [Sesbania bispinosa]
MEMKKSLWIVLVITMIVVSSQFCFVHSRVLRTEVLKTRIGDGCEEFKETEAASLGVGMATFAVSSNNSSARHSARSLAYRLASGPSKKGRGH